MVEHQQVSARQRGWAVAALVAHVAAAAWWIWMTDGFLFDVCASTAVMAVVPFLTLGRPKAFARACLLIGWGVLAWSLIGTIIGMFVFLPGALLLLTAAFVQPGNRPGAGFAVGVPLAVVLASAGVLSALQGPDPDNEPPPSLHATMDSMDRFHDRELNLRKEGLREFGALDAGMVEMEPGRLVLVVEMPDHFPEAQTQDRLMEEVRRLPGVVDVRVCTFHTC
ncbi:hypothetical protein [Streptomyces sp. NPDC058157]|uniref:hypothetical protein n=1 Tax=Streptomyces sp. NPDC058157 TaxID=3346360 RepID=UPI0036F0FA35